MAIHVCSQAESSRFDNSNMRCAVLLSLYKASINVYRRSQVATATVWFFVFAFNLKYKIDPQKHAWILAGCENAGNNREIRKEKALCYPENASGFRYTL